MNKQNLTIIGINSPYRANGSDLRDGNACLLSIRNYALSSVIAIQEERLSRKRYDNSIKRSIDYCLRNSSSRTDEDIIVAFSSALDRKWSIGEVESLLSAEFQLSPKAIHVIDHHDSHAFEAFATSPFSEAIVLVIDSMGNQLDADEHGNDSWETQTYYIMRREISGKISSKVLLRECVTHPGYGQLFRAATRYIGFPGYHHASKLMAIAGIGKHLTTNSLPTPHIFHKDKLKLNVDLNPENVYGPLQAWLSSCGIHNHLPRDDSWYTSGNYAQNGRKSLRPLDTELAAAIQQGYETFLITRIKSLVQKTGLKNVCIGGGTALNCVANALILQEGIADQVYVGCSPSDAGQGLGNALYLLNEYAPELIYSIRPPYFGIKYSSSYITSVFKKDNGKLLPTNDYDVIIAERLACGEIVALFHGCSEYGPRALGNRSILASPSVEYGFSIIHKLSAIKNREDYQPFAISILSDYYDEISTCKSPYMSFAPNVANTPLADHLRHIIHDDGTCRLQTVSRQDNPFFYDILLKFYQLTGIPCLINTSLNLRGEPIVETPEQALKLWKQAYHIDGIFIEGNYLTQANR